MFEPENKEEWEVSDLWDRLVDEDIATSRELELVTDIVGYTKEAMYDVLYARTGYRNFEQMDSEV